MRHAMIMAGGAGTRLWPMSRRGRPKQLLPLVRGRSLLELAFERLEGLVPAERRWVCAAREHEAVVRRVLPTLGAERYLGEPCGRDTLHAVGLGAQVIALADPDAVVGVFTADHLIEPQERFRAAVQTAFETAESVPRALVTLGVRPRGPSTAYGYLELGEPIGGAVRRVVRFREKPPAELAREFVAAGPDRFLWNSGMFVWRASVIQQAIARYRPESATALDRIAAAWTSADRTAVLEREYAALRPISVDYAVMEPASRDSAFTVAACPLDADWTDVGSWPALAAVAAKDADRNAQIGARTLLLDVRDSLVVSEDPQHLVAAIGLERVVIVHTPGATLVCAADRAEEIKRLHQRLAAEGFGELL
ncbi:MAG: mannose-1-phosphate guanylyltransferase [Kiritimatiellae bacterium]|nr:mannose-1-phosphate guanylyltransferase [Kiritimatiellia bacterium]